MITIVALCVGPLEVKKYKPAPWKQRRGLDANLADSWEKHMDQSDTWNFAVIGCDSSNLPRYLGFVNTYEEAIKFGENAKRVGWSHVKVFDAFLLEVKEDPERGN